MVPVVDLDIVRVSSGQRDLQITSVTSPASAQLLISWNSTSSLVSYFMLELRVVNNTSIAPITAFISLSSRSRLMQGLRAGTYYHVTLRSYAANGAVLSTVWVQSQTVPATPQITTTNGISSSEVMVSWTSQAGVDYYFLMLTLGTETVNRTVTALNCNVAGLQPSSLYNVALYAVNSAGPSAVSRRMTVLTLTPPPTAITVTPLTSYSVMLTWLSVEKALMYGIFIYEDGPDPQLTVIRKTTSTSITLENLHPCTKYIFGLTSYNWFYVSGEENRVLHKTGNLDSPEDITIQYSSNMGKVFLTWKSSIGASLYVASAKSKNGHEVMCNTSSTTCEIQGFLCEQKYTVHVIAQSASCSSNSSNILTLETAPCAPENVTIIRDCQINTVRLHWNPIIDAIKYTALALAPDGSIEQCTNRETHCFFLNLPCGTDYEMSVYAFNGKINGSSSQPIKMRTAPCDPKNVEAISKCNDNTLSVSWNQSVGAISYVASALGSSGVSYNCSSEGTSCLISGLQCGESISVSVIAYDNDCPSGISEQKEIATGPCTPKNISAMTDCQTHSTLIQWQNSEGAISYVAYANSNKGSEYTCKSFDQSCTITDLPCGETFSVFVTASNYECESPSSRIVEIKTAPCIPRKIENELRCDQNTVFVKWLEDFGNLTFKATAEQKGAGFYNCTTQGYDCEIKNINCGQLYSVSVQADNGQCISSTNWTTPFYSAPCRPTQLAVNTICANGSVEISWVKSQGLGVELYVAVMNSLGGQHLMCQSTSESCIIQETQCGEAYTATVTAVNSNCQTVSSTLYVDPVPCSPMDLAVHVAPNVVGLSWMDMPGAINYTTEVTGNGGDKHLCHTSNTTCLMTDLMCGHQYNMSVTAVGKWCSSKASSTKFQTAPCIPQNVSRYLDCITNVVTVSWDRSQGADNYISEAIGLNGKHHTCNTTGTSCIFSDLVCGRVYSLTVSATNGNLRSEPSQLVQFHTVPCQPQNVTAQVNCRSSAAYLSWNKADGALRYTTTLSSPGEEHSVCNSTELGCEVVGLQCGKTYNVTVKAFNNQCESKPSFPAELYTVPCSPMNLAAQVSSNHVSLSWMDAHGALNYTTDITGEDGEKHTSQTSNITYLITELMCGHQYNASVTAFGYWCQSDVSSSHEFQTAPCTPQNVTTSLDCVNNTATVSWNNVLGATNYTAVVTGKDGELHVCNSTNTLCDFVSLTCGRTYLVTVAATNGMSHSDPSVPVELQMAPCITENVSPMVDCKDNSAALSWSGTLGAENYTAVVVGPDNKEHTCHTANTSCHIPALRCGVTYKVTVMAFNSQCQGKNSTAIPFITAPCAPTSFHAETDCVEGSVTLSWQQVPGAEYYMGYLMGSGGLNRTCSPTQPNCTISNLPCGQDYTVALSAANSQCRGPMSQSIRVLTAPCIPLNVNTFLDCMDNSALITWNQARGAVNYTSSVTGLHGEKYNCSSHDTSCWMRDLPCGETFAVMVTAQNDMCTSAENSLRILQTCPCVPQNLTIISACGSNMVTLQWVASPGAMFYMGTMTSSKEDIYVCNTTDTACNINGIKCGETYNVSLTVFNNQLASVSLEHQIFQTAPCVPTNIMAELQCGTDLALVRWDSALGATMYTVVVTGINGWNKICTTPNITCEITGLECGQIYGIDLTAYNSQCSSVASPVEFHTEPCVPQNMKAEVLCGMNMAAISWNRPPGALNYTAVVRGPHGQEHSCSTNESTCSIGMLTCGQRYNVTVTAFGDQCTTESRTSEFHSSPCTPTNVSTQIHCEDNTATVTWNPSSGAESYISRITTVNEEEYSCNSTGSSCDVNAMLCGHTYTVTVTAVNAQCTSEPSAPAQLKTGPCVPQILDTLPLCVTDFLTLSWGETSGAERYVGILMESSGNALTCNTTDGSCDIRAIECGRTYTASVAAFNDQCSSGNSSFVTVKAAPCVPTDLSGSVTCDTHSVTLSWDSARGADIYTIIAQNGEHESLCVTSNTSCNFTDLLCDEDYEFTIISSSESCNSTGNKSIHLETIPCAPQILDVYTMCGNNSGFVQWDKSQNARSYMVSANSFDTTLSCNTFDTSCELQNLNCGENYTVTVFAEDGICQGPGSTDVTFQSAPCVPTNIRVELECGTDLGSLWWDSALGATMYSAVVTGANGWNITCTSQTTTCDISGLECGQTYSVLLTASNFHCSSVASPVEFYTEPCVPQNVMAVVLCGTNMTALSWDRSSGALNYTAVVRGSHGEDYACTTFESTCSIEMLACGQIYNVTVTAFGDQCKTESAYLVFHSRSKLPSFKGPCTPTNVSAQINCENNTAAVSWNPSSGAQSYISRVFWVNEEPFSCNSTGSTCDVSALPCGHTFAITVTAVNDQCTSEPSAPVQLQTGPCVPQILDTLPRCARDFISLSWGETYGAEHYVGTLMASSGNALTCNTTDGSCDIRAIECGRTYTASVAAFNDQCSSGNSSSVMIKTAPCVPTDLSGSVTCDTHSVTLSWDSARGADIYTVTAHNGEHESLCVTSNTSCNFTDLLCDEDYEFTISSSSESCNSTGNKSIHFKTIPCAPQILDAYAACENNSGLVDWHKSKNARSYLVNAHGFNSFRTCNTSDTSCELHNLECGQNYTVTVWAEDGTCRGPGSTQVTFKSVPCIPQNVVSTVICGDNALLVSWNSSSGATGYTATATGRHGHLLTVNTFETSCMLPMLECGEVYTLTVLATHDDCKSTESSEVEFVSAPCSPQHLTATPQCHLMGASAFWESSKGAKSYVTEFIGPEGNRTTCNTNDTSCSVSGLGCGQVYDVTVTAFDDNCHSLTTNITQMASAPCAPTEAMAEIDCTGHSINVTWTPSTGAESYTVVALGNDGQTVYCNTTMNSCNITNLLCGYSYSVSIIANNKDCSSEMHSVGVFDTVPCTPDNVLANIDCVTNEALVSWQENNYRQTFYTAIARDISGNELSCSTLSSSCRISDLGCGQEYFFEVTAGNRHCHSRRSEVYKLKTAPCVPEKTKVLMDCKNSSATLLWEASRGALSYLASVYKDENLVHSCDTEQTLCTAHKLNCGSTYMFSVLATDVKCNSSTTAPILSGLVPCPPDQVETSIYHGTVKPQEVEVSWNESHCGVDYMAAVQGEIANDPNSLFILNSYWTSYMDFYIPVPCSSSYNVTVTARNSAGMSFPSDPVEGYTAPCSPSVKSLEVINGKMFISWEDPSHTEEYIVLDVASDDILCRTTSLSCEVPITSSTLHLIAVNEAGESEPSVLSTVLEN
ncbi:uncharacterized protein LOC128500923 [Spea bombifrons]|uniref:uncharacterized protein LOC128500923 n=1 Tax=Spea bombifrons TaxID=233779 RepID=UPI00234A9609|nr:uncharacterized protein LOC128500923 [Spea bombifrons]